MPSRRDATLAREQLKLAAPVCDDASLEKLKEEVAEFICEAKRRDTLKPEELASPAIDQVSRKYFQHIFRRQGLATPLRRRNKV